MVPRTLNTNREEQGATAARAPGCSPAEPPLRSNDMLIPKDDDNPFCQRLSCARYAEARCGGGASLLGSFPNTSRSSTEQGADRGRTFSASGHTGPSKGTAKGTFSTPHGQAPCPSPSCEPDLSSHSPSPDFLPAPPKRAWPPRCPPAVCPGTRVTTPAVTASYERMRILPVTGTFRCRKLQFPAWDPAPRGHRCK